MVHCSHKLDALYRIYGAKNSPAALQPDRTVYETFSLTPFKF